MSKRIQRFRFAAAAAVSVALLVPMAVFAGTGFAHSPSAAQYQYKIIICHHTGSKTNPMVTISISSSAWPAHFRHGDTIGACKPPAAPTPATPTGHGKGDHGNGHSKGHGKK